MTPQAKIKLGIIWLETQKRGFPENPDLEFAEKPRLNAHSFINQQFITDIQRLGKDVKEIATRLLLAVLWKVHRRYLAALHMEYDLTGIAYQLRTK